MIKDIDDPVVEFCRSRAKIEDGLTLFRNSRPIGGKDVKDVFRCGAGYGLEELKRTVWFDIGPRWSR